MTSPLRWSSGNLGALLLAFVLAVVVWASAVMAADPNVERSRNVSIEVASLDPEMLLVGNVPTQVNVTLRAPTSISERMVNTPQAVRAWIDLTGLGAGTHEVNVHVHINEVFHPVRLLAQNPEQVTITLEPLITRSFPVKLEVSGEPAVGYQKGLPSRNPTFVTVSGPQSLVSRVQVVRAVLNITDSTDTIKADLALYPLSGEGQPVAGVTLRPDKVTVTQPISLQGGYRNVVVRVVTTSQVANGYKLTNISVSPPNVIVFSTDPRLVNELPSFVETIPLDLSGAEDDIDTRLALNLPPGISVVDDQSVLVQVSVAAIESSVRLSLPLTVIGLTPTYLAQVSPASVDVILAGPAPILSKIRATDIRLILDVKDLGVGIYQIAPQVDILPERLAVESILPTWVEVSITEAPTPTPMPTVTPTLVP